MNSDLEPYFAPCIAKLVQAYWRYDKEGFAEVVVKDYFWKQWDIFLCDKENRAVIKAQLYKLVGKVAMPLDHPVCEGYYFEARHQECAIRQFWAEFNEDGSFYVSYNTYPDTVRNGSANYWDLFMAKIKYLSPISKRLHAVGTVILEHMDKPAPFHRMLERIFEIAKH